MSNFLKDVIKETGNEYAALASDGISGGDVTNFIDTGSYLSTHYYQVVFTVVYQETELQQSLVKQQQVKLSLR